VWGEAGIGKTRLVAEFCKSAVLGGATVLRAVSQPHDVRRPMGAFLDLTPRLLKLPGALGTSPEAMRYLQRLVTFDPQLDKPLTPEMRDPEYLAACITRALSELLDAVTAEGTLILVIEDAQWLDRVSTMVLGDLLSERKERRLLLVSTWRSREDPTPKTPFPERTLSIPVPPLESSDAERLVREQLRQLAVPPIVEVLEWSVRTAQGNPFFLHELARHYAVHREVGQVPESLVYLVKARIAQLSESARLLLTSCALLGAHASVDRLAQLIQLDTAETTKSLAEAERAGLIDGGAKTLATCHPLVTELLLQDLPTATRKLLHTRAAQVLKDEESTTVSLAIAASDHWIAAGEIPKGIATLRNAARALEQMGLLPEALILFGRAIEVCPPGSARYDLRLQQLAAASLLRDADQLRFVVSAVRDDTSIPPDDPIRLEASIALLKRRFHDGESPALLLADLERLDTSFAPSRLLPQLAFVQLMFADQLSDADKARAAMQLLERADASIESSDRCSAHLIYHTRFGASDAALVYADRLVSQHSVPDLSPVQVRILSNAACAYMGLGRPDRALALFATLLSETLRTGMAGLAFAAAVNGATSALLANDIQATARWYAKADSMAVGTFDFDNLRHLLATGTLLALRTSDVPSAEKRISRLRGLVVPNTRFARLYLGIEACLRVVSGGEYSDVELSALTEATEAHLGDDQYDFLIEACGIALAASGRLPKARAIYERHVEQRRQGTMICLLLPERSRVFAHPPA
jgi:tetratricopeptide (TPR) repeat protein